MIPSQVVYSYNKYVDSIPGQLLSIMKLIEIGILLSSKTCHRNELKGKLKKNNQLTVNY